MRVLHEPSGEATTTWFTDEKKFLGPVIFFLPLLEGFTQTRTDTIGGSLLACDPVVGAPLDLGIGNSFGRIPDWIRPMSSLFICGS